MGAFALVHEAVSLSDCCASLSEFLVVRQRVNDNAASARLLGLWFSPTPVTDAPVTMGTKGPLGHGRLRVREATSLSGLWTLCWLDGLQNEHRDRELLLENLLQDAPDHGGAVSRRFVPIFCTGAEAAEVKTSLNALSRFGPYVADPVYQDAGTSRIVMPRCDHRKAGAVQ